MPNDREPPPLFNPRISPGEIYKGIKTEDRDFSSAETRLVKPVVPVFVRFARWCAKTVRPDSKYRYSAEYKEAIDFLGWDLKDGEFNSAVSFVLIASLFAAAVIGLFLMFIPILPNCDSFDPLTGAPTCTATTVFAAIAGIAGNELMAMLYLFGPLVLGALVVIRFVQQYPLSKAKEEQIKALTYVPEIIGYMTMSMKLVPNLERAIEFAAEHGRGKIAEDLKKMIWEVQLGFYNTLSEGLDALAYRWGKFSDEFKRSLMMVRASVLEESESKRYLLLDKTVVEMLDSIRNKMENYARQLSQPSIMLFYLGVLLPLILIIILPVGSAFSGAPLARPEILALIYNIVIPIGAFLYAKSVIQNRPPTYEPPVIPSTYPGLPPQNSARIGKTFVNLYAVVIVLVLVGVGGSLFISDNGIPLGTDEIGAPVYLIAPDLSESEVLFLDNKPENYFGPEGPRSSELSSQFPDPVARELQLDLEKQRYFVQGQNDTTPYKLVFGLLLTLGAAAAVFLYFSSIFKRKVQLETIQMETEFRDSLYILASRMGENKPVEEALLHTRNFLPNTLVADRIYGKTIENIQILGMPLESAVFDKNFGSLKNIPSATIQSAMKLLVDSVNLGVNVSARTLMSLSIQLSNSEKVIRMLSVLVREITSMMHTMAVFIAPIVLGITTSLQKVVMITLSQVVQSNTLESAPTTALNVPGFSNLSSLSNANFLGQNPEVFQTMVTPVQFIVIVAIYLIELVIIMTYYNTKIEEDNDVLFRLNLAQSLPIALIVFIVSVLLSNSIVGALGS